MSDAEILQNWLSKMKSKDERRSYRTLIRVACGVTRTQVCHWISGRNKIRNIYKKEINNIAKEKLFDVE